VLYLLYLFFIERMTFLRALLIVIVIQYLILSEAQQLPGSQIAVLITDTFKDLGYNNRIVVGVRAMEAVLNISGVRIVEKVTSKAQAMEVMDGLVKEGYKLMVSTTSAHGTASYEMALRYPNVSFCESTTGSGA
jgi:basic membrane lipoprotein Med (substrate-binding protein (PBP1-ABC) superfamily)